jgi:hypothetical protein
VFRTLGRLIVDPTLANTAAEPSSDVFRIHPLQLSRWLELAWTFAELGKIGWATLNPQVPFLGDPGIVDALALPDAPQPLLTTQLASGITSTGVTPPPYNPHLYNSPPALGQNIPLGIPWDHLIYALLIENTGVYEILAEVLRRYVIGETLEVPSLETEQWLRGTEELFFRNPPLFHIFGITSDLRPDMRIGRRNAYWRMFGMDLAHPLPPTYPAPVSGELPWKRDVGVANLRFRELFVEFLREVWIGMENLTNSSGAKPTDDAYISVLSQQLRDLLAMRRRRGMLAREEFVHVTTLSWFHLTVESDTPLVNDLKANGTDPADRLVKIGARVGITCPPHAREYFELADVLSTTLRFVELGAFDDPANAPLLYNRASKIGQDMNHVIDLWQMATGDRLKDAAVRDGAAARAASRRPLASGRPPLAPPTKVPAGTNGSRPS